MTTDRDGRPTPVTDDGALWSREEIRLQASQTAGQLDVWDILQATCPDHGAGCTSLLCGLLCGLS